MMNSLRMYRWPLCAMIVGVVLLGSTPTRASSTLNFPRLSFDQTTFTGVAFVNPSDEDALVTLTAYGEDGQVMTGIQNPVQVVVPANAQLAQLTSEYFGAGPDPGTIAWFQATTTTDGLSGFFLFVNGTVTEFDGADTPVSGAGIVFNRIGVDSVSSTELNIINPGAASASLVVELVSSGSSPILMPLSLAAMGVAQLDVATFFGVSEVSSDSYVKVTSDVEIAGFEFVRTVGQDLLGLNAQPAEDQLSNLYFPQLAVLGPWETELNLVNTSEQSVILTLSVFQENGFLFDTGDLENNPIVRTLDGGASLSEDVEAMFGFTGDSVQQGWLLVESTSAAINGSISYGLAGSVASVAASATGQKRALFSHIATSGGFFTGVALLNSGQLATNVRLLAITPGGEVLGSYNTVLQPGQRVSQLIDQLIPQATGLDGGLIWVKSESPIHLTSVFGNPTVLANIPPQQAPESYEPDSGLAPVAMTPALAVLQLGQSQPFQITGLEDVEWNVNGVAGGSETAGSVTGSGIYEAPEAVPETQVLTVIAESEGQAAGASVDILQKEDLLISSAIVQSVAYLGSLDRLYTAELTLLSNSEEGPAPAAQKPAQTSGDTEIVEVSPTQVRVSLVEFAGEEISKMISFEASTGDEYLLAAAKTSGKVIRIDPRTRETQDVATGLNQPESLVLDPVTGDLLVAESDKVSTVSQSDLEAGLSAAARLSPDRGRNQAVELFPADQVDGITVDLCTGTIYISNRATGEIMAYDRDSSQLSAIFRGLDEPTRLQGIHRLRVSCPDSFQILALERGLDVVDLLSPTCRTLRRWIAASGSYRPGHSRRRKFRFGWHSLDRNH